MRTIFTLIITLIFSISSQGQTDLSLKLEQGKEYKQKTDLKATIKEDINGQEFTMVMAVQCTMTFLVQSVTDTNYEMDAKYDSLSMTLQLPQGTMEFSSEKIDTNDIFSTIMRAMINKTFGVIMDRTGKIIEVKNVEALWETAINQFDQISEMQKEQVKAQITKAYGTEAFKGNIEMVTAIFPENPVNKGDKWTINTNLEAGMSGKMTTVYEFTDLTSDYASITGNSIIGTADKDAYVEISGMPMKYDMQGSMQSEIKVDRNTGWIIEARIYQETKGDAYIKENPQMPEGMKIPITLINNMVITN